MPYPRTIADAYQFSPYAAFWRDAGRPPALPERAPPAAGAGPFAAKRTVEAPGREAKRSVGARAVDGLKLALGGRVAGDASKRGVAGEAAPPQVGRSAAGTPREAGATLTTPRAAWYPKAVDTAEQLVQDALAGDRDAVRALVDRVGPVIQARVGRVAARGRSRQGEQLRQVVADLTQEVFVSLFQEQGRVLRGWTPARGLSLEAYVGMVAEHQAISFLRSGRRSGWREDATGDQAIELSAGGHAGVHERVHARQTLTRLLDRMRETLSPKGLTLFELLVVEERSVPEVCEAMSMSPDAVYAWRSRLAKTASALLAEIESEDVAPKPAPPAQRG
ncbi:MAG TPA: sigma-70 family RNA polymerase sigma factor [Polyangiaceae bacterium]|nr:sigma-70 family RNA polymerase sigma factor [Polyangiaceae bacterium]